jgi:hypothetical protein
MEDRLSKKIKKLAVTMYASPETDAAFARARQLFPNWNDGGEDTDRAVEHILGAIQRRFPDSLSEKERDDLTLELESMVYAALT